jgi:hypothetical protein
MQSARPAGSGGRLRCATVACSSSSDCSPHGRSAVSSSARGRGWSGTVLLVCFAADRGAQCSGTAGRRRVRVRCSRGGQPAPHDQRVREDLRCAADLSRAGLAEPGGRVGCDESRGAPLRARRAARGGRARAPGARGNGAAAASIASHSVRRMCDGRCVCCECGAGALLQRRHAARVAPRAAL